MKQFVDSLGFPTNIVTTAENIVKELAKGNIEVPLCEDEFYRKKWDFQNETWIEGATPEEIAEQELEKQKLLKQQQYEELLPTDWYVIRFIERGIPIPEEILEQRQEIINRYS